MKMIRLPALRTAGFTMIELMITIAISSFVMVGVYRMLYLPYRMNLIAHNATDYQTALRSLDIVAADISQADASSFPATLIVAGNGLLPAWISRTNRDAKIPYSFVQYAYAASPGATQGALLRFYNDQAVVPANAGTAGFTPPLVPTTVIAPIAQPGSTLPDGTFAPPLFSADSKTDPRVLTVAISYEPAGITLHGGKQAVYTVYRRVSLRN